MRERLPIWVQDWLGIIIPFAQVLLILLAAWLLARTIGGLVRRIVARHGLPAEIAVMLRRVIAFLLYAAAALAALERFGVSGTVLWTAFTGFAAVGAVAFFAAWSVLSNIFCTVLIFTTGTFRLGDHVELLENGEKPGLKGRVIDVNLIYTTLQEVSIDQGETDSVLQVPNNLFFQRTLRRWRSGSGVPAHWLAVPAPQVPAVTASLPAANA